MKRWPIKFVSLFSTTKLLIKTESMLSIGLIMKQSQNNFQNIGEGLIIDAIFQTLHAKPIKVERFNIIIA